MHFYDCEVKSNPNDMLHYLDQLKCTHRKKDIFLIDDQE